MCILCILYPSYGHIYYDINEPRDGQSILCILTSYPHQENKAVKLSPRYPVRGEAHKFLPSLCLHKVQRLTFYDPRGSSLVIEPCLKVLTMTTVWRNTNLERTATTENAIRNQLQLPIAESPAGNCSMQNRRQLMT